MSDTPEQSERPEQFYCAPLDKHEKQAISNLAKGEATEYQQRLALKVIVNKFSRAHDVLYIPGSFDASAFLSGRGYVGALILQHLNIPVGQLEDTETHPNARS